mgnify:CR=1 FL=1
MTDFEKQVAALRADETFEDVTTIISYAAQKLLSDDDQTNAQVVVQALKEEVEEAFDRDVSPKQVLGSTLDVAGKIAEESPWKGDNRLINGAKRVGKAFGLIE